MLKRDSIVFELVRLLAVISVALCLIPAGAHFFELVVSVKSVMLPPNEKGRPVRTARSVQTFGLSENRQSKIGVEVQWARAPLTKSAVGLDAPLVCRGICPTIMDLDFRKVLPLLPEPEFPQLAFRAVAARLAFVR